MVLYRIYYLMIDRPTKNVHCVWKVLHLLTQSLAAITGVINAVQFYRFTQGFGLNCPLYAELEFTRLHEASMGFDILPHNVSISERETVWGKNIYCEYTLSMWLISFIAGLVLGTFFLWSRTGGAGLPTDSFVQPWKHVLPALIVSIIMTVLITMAAWFNFNGLDEFCNEFINYLHTKRCNNDIDLFSLPYNGEILRIHMSILVMRICVPLCLVAWLLHTGVLIVRICIAPDFDVQIVKVIGIKKTLKPKQKPDYEQFPRSYIGIRGTLPSLHSLHFQKRSHPVVRFPDDLPPKGHKYEKQSFNINEIPVDVVVDELIDSEEITEMPSSDVKKLIESSHSIHGGIESISQTPLIEKIKENLETSFQQRLRFQNPSTSEEFNGKNKPYGGDLIDLNSDESTKLNNDFEIPHDITIDTLMEPTGIPLKFVKTIVKNTPYLSQSGILKQPFLVSQINSNIPRDATTSNISARENESFQFTPMDPNIQEDLRPIKSILKPYPGGERKEKNLSDTPTHEYKQINENIESHLNSEDTQKESIQDEFEPKIVLHTNFKEDVPHSTRDTQILDPGNFDSIKSEDSPYTNSSSTPESKIAKSPVQISSDTSFSDFVSHSSEITQNSELSDTPVIPADVVIDTLIDRGGGIRALPMNVLKQLIKNAPYLNQSGVFKQPFLASQIFPTLNETQQKLIQQELSQKKLSQVELPQQELTQQELSLGKLSQLELPQQKLTQEELTQQELSQGKLSQGKLSQGKLSQELSQKLPQYKLPQEQSNYDTLPSTSKAQPNFSGITNGFEELNPSLIEKNQKSQEIEKDATKKSEVSEAHNTPTHSFPLQIYESNQLKNKSPASPSASDVPSITNQDQLLRSKSITKEIESKPITKDIESKPTIKNIDSKPVIKEIESKPYSDSIEKGVVQKTEFPQTSTNSSSLPKSNQLENKSASTSSVSDADLKAQKDPLRKESKHGIVTDKPTHVSSTSTYNKQETDAIFRQDSKRSDSTGNQPYTDQYGIIPSSLDMKDKPSSLDMKDKPLDKKNKPALDKKDDTSKLDDTRQKQFQRIEHQPQVETPNQENQFAESTIEDQSPHLTTQELHLNQAGQFQQIQSELETPNQEIEFAERTFPRIRNQSPRVTHINADLNQSLSIPNNAQIRRLPATVQINQDVRNEVPHHDLVPHRRTRVLSPTPPPLFGTNRGALGGSIGEAPLHRPQRSIPPIPRTDRIRTGLRLNFNVTRSDDEGEQDDSENSSNSGNRNAERRRR